MDLQEKDVYSDHLTAIIDELSKDAEIKRMTKQIRDIEITTRNISAHNLVSITASWVKNTVDTRQKKFTDF